jgi:hypothetical protein
MNPETLDKISKLPFEGHFSSIADEDIENILIALQRR